MSSTWAPAAHPFLARRDLAHRDLAAYFEQPIGAIVDDPDARGQVELLLDALERGEVRCATPDGAGDWQVHGWVKQGILAAFRLSDTVVMQGWPGGAIDRSLVAPRRIVAEDGVRMVPGGSSVRRGAALRPGVVVMPPAYVNIGAYVGVGSMVDSHALVGSCAQIGARVHLSAGVQVGGVLEPVGARPVIVEDDAFVGAQCGLFEGVLVRRGAVLAPGTLLTGATRIYDLVNETELRGEVPERAVVVPGGRPAGGGWAHERGLVLSAACIVKYRDGSTDAATVLEEALR